MTSPVASPLLGLLTIDREISKEIYLQIAEQLGNAIQRGLLPEGMKLPGSRQLAAQVNVHRQTMIAAYRELEAQGWIQTYPNRGSFVLMRPKEKFVDLYDQDASASAQGYPVQAGFSFKRSNILDNPWSFQTGILALDDGLPDMRLSQLHHLSAFYAANLKRKGNLKKLERYNTDGSEYFKEQLCAYLNESRGLRISENNILVTRSTEMSLYITSKVMLSPGDLVIVGALSYFAANMILQESGARMLTVPVDDQGLDTAAIRALCLQRRIRMVYVTSHHHYPTTVTLSAQRRIELLSLSREFGFAIVEDDYDYEFRYDRKPVLPMASADTDGMVIYFGSFGKTLAPGFRTGFTVAPKDIMQEMRKYLGIIDRQGDITMELALGEMIAEGEIQRYAKKSLKVYEERLAHCAAALRAHLSPWLSFTEPSGGLALWTTWKSGINLSAFAQRCDQQGLHIPKNMLYQQKGISGVRMGFGRLNKAEMEEAINMMKQVLQEIDNGQ